MLSSLSNIEKNHLQSGNNITKIKKNVLSNVTNNYQKSINKKSDLKEISKLHSSKTLDPLSAKINQKSNDKEVKEDLESKRFIEKTSRLSIHDKENIDPNNELETIKKGSDGSHINNYEKKVSTKEGGRTLELKERNTTNPSESFNVSDIQKKRPISTLSEIGDLPKKLKYSDDIDNEKIEWDDLDAEDANDPFMASEYVSDIFDHLRELEMKTLPIKENLHIQKNIVQNRDILINWLVKIHNKFGLLPETLYLATNLMDRFLAKELVQLDKLQLVGTSCLFIASKYEEVYSPSVAHFAGETDGACSVQEIKEGEKFILKVLEFDLSYPNPMNFLRRISKADDYDIQSRTLAKFLLEISIVDFKFIGIPPSFCAAAAMFISRKMLGKSIWDGNLIHYSGGYTKKQLEPVCNLMMDYLVSPIVHDEFIRKYQSRRYMKASIISVNWALKVKKNKYDIMTLHE
ncbi:hypothetical protein TPHA_0D03070 [Tetrapisispora phaffii CBS 4417]|uniref:Cyclin N-terminal domain-containing protein n=1 Tax=Tetrapisispora phaffii (strain ATCC 24235 / CBS 4417 / NBRC 1672 / NRRL Y-8282 / UCD 70-5) TaxID=1071381 RepID=G8BSX2_TETPH|nr:hypothetical protein TPHA_0D03070 [Tetrapisispora phaffii CBS 4417]CCE62943.1 hypothetical protein TPHA_0D03070 [Tetrapisispora phaffii CBS 4417]